jgi:DHA2 family multidrug resistance protein
MPISAKLSRTMDPRLQLALGATILGGAVMWLARLTTSTGQGDLFWPLLIQRFGTVLMFVPLSMVSLGSIPKKDIAASTALYNLTRQLGGSVGVAALTTILGSRTTFHRSAIVEHLSMSDPNVQARVNMMASGFMARGQDAVTAKQTALTLLDGSARLQGSVLAFNDTFLITACLVLFSLPVIFILGKPQKMSGSVDAH